MNEKYSFQLKGLTSSFGKDLDSEQALFKMNRLLLPLELERSEGLDEPLKPCLFILGPPRSGSTLVSQLLNQVGVFGLVNNFVSRFWMAPSVGMLIDLAINGPAKPSNYRSRRGNTEGLSEPNEFGYFWSHYFDKGQKDHFLNSENRQKFDKAGLLRSVAAMESVQEKPMAFKNNTWFTLNADFLAQIFPKSVFVVCRRDALFTARSVLKQRFDLYGDGERWWSMRPPKHEKILKCSPIDQVAFQAVAIECWMEESLRKIPSARIVEARYEKVINSTHEFLTNVGSSVNVNVASLLSAIPERFENHDQKESGPDFELLRHAVESWRAKFAREPEWLS